MSGHSKWSNIKFKKEITDKKKGKLFTKLAHQITLAAREKSDVKLKLAIEKAKQANLPSVNIERAVKRGKGELSGVKIEDVMYEALGPQKVAILIFVTTDNKNRTTSEIRNILDKNSAKLSGTGSVAWMFEPKGVIRVGYGDRGQSKETEGKDTENRGREKIELIAIDAGAQDIENQDNEILVYTDPRDLIRIRQELEKENIEIVNVEIINRAKNSVKITDPEKANQILKLMDDLDNIEGVTRVSSNFNIPEELIEK